MQVIDENKELLDAIGDFSSGDNTEKLNQIMQTADKYADIGNLSDSDTDLLAERVKAWVNYGVQYKIFTECPANYESSVMFVYKTDAVNARA